jgi:NAD(P)-dependent dehydrogenase (short-subunit alcohol dehydrogenase family)
MTDLAGHGPSSPLVPRGSDYPGEPRAAIVTGASRGIGLAIAEALVKRGDKVCITGRNAEPLAEAVASLGADSAVFVAGKAHDSEHQDEVVAKTLETFGRIDYLVNNVGTNPVYGPMLDLDSAAVRKILDVNLISAFEWTQKVYRAWMKNNGGAVVNVASVAALRPAPGLGMYGLSKAAMKYLTEQLAVELGPTIRVNAVAPAVVKTVFARALYEGREAEVAARYPAGRLGVPSDVGNAVAYLLSDQASWITGQTWVLDGGATLKGGVE